MTPAGRRRITGWLLALVAGGLLSGLTAACGSAGPAQLTTTIEPASGQPKPGEPAPSVKPGDRATYKVVVENEGPDLATGVNVRVELPSQLTYRTTVSVAGEASRTQPVDPDVHSGRPQWGVWSLGAPRTNEDGTQHRSQMVLTFAVDVAGRPGNYQVIAHATGDNLQDESVSDPLAVEVASAPDLHAVVSVNPTIVHRDLEVTYTVAVENKGTAPSSGVGVLVTLPPVLAYTTTVSLTGNFSRSQPIDPIKSTAVAYWGGFSIPPGSDSGPGTLNVIFRARCENTAVAGKFPVNAQLTDDSGTVVNVKDTSPVQVVP